MLKVQLGRRRRLHASAEEGRKKQGSGGGGHLGQRLQSRRAPHIHRHVQVRTRTRMGQTKDESISTRIRVIQVVQSDLIVCLCWVDFDKNVPSS